MKKSTVLLIIMILLSSYTISQTKVNPKEFPYTYIVKLLMYKDGSTFHGTGIMINENSIITNAHNVFNKDSISAYPGYSKNDKTPFGKITIKCELSKTIFYPEDYKIDSLQRFNDFAIIKFKNEDVYKKVLEKSNNKKFQIEIVENLDSTTINVSGYPFFRWFEFWKARRASVHYHNSTDKYTISENILLNYKMNTRKGSSGSPLWIEKDDKLIVIGIHKSGTGFRNQGIFYDKERVQLLKKWINK